MSITSNTHGITKIELEAVRRRELDDGCVYYSRSLRIKTEATTVAHTLFADSADALALPEEKLKEENAKRISGLRSGIQELQQLLPYADHRAYGQDQARIARMQNEIRNLEGQAQHQA